MLPPKEIKGLTVLAYQVVERGNDEFDEVLVPVEELLQRQRAVLQVDLDPEEPYAFTMFPCQKCAKGFIIQEHADRHQDKCNADKKVNCNPRFRIARGKDPVSGKSSKEYVCKVPGCIVNESFPSKYSLHKHFYDEHVQESDRAFHCDFGCGERFAHRTLRNDHVRLKHEKKHICHVCGKQFGERHRLLSHQAIHTGDRPFACDLCDYRAIRRDNLQKHKEVKHNEEQTKNCFCEHCGKAFTNPGNLKGHITVVHMQTRTVPIDIDVNIDPITRPHECRYCEFKTRKKGTLARHIEMKHEYDGSKFYCSSCGKGFKHYVYLKEHMMYVHEGKPRKKSDPKTRRRGTGQGARQVIKNETLVG